MIILIFGNIATEILESKVVLNTGGSGDIIFVITLFVSNGVTNNSEVIDSIPGLSKTMSTMLLPVNLEYASNASG